MRDEKRLSEVGVGSSCRIIKINTAGQVGKRLADLGAGEGVAVSCVGISPLGDPRAYFLLGSIFAIRNCDAARIEVCSESKGALYEEKDSISGGVREMRRM